MNQTRIRQDREKGYQTFTCKNSTYNAKVPVFPCVTDISQAGICQGPRIP